MIRNEQAKAALALTKPKMTTTWAAGFAFSKVSYLSSFCFSPMLLSSSSSSSSYYFLIPVAVAVVSCQCHAEYKVPYDPHLPSVFDGEEFSKFVRLWTRLVVERY